VTRPGWCGVPALGVPAHLLGLGIAQLVSTAWPIAILRWSLGAGLSWSGCRLWQNRVSRICSFQLGRDEHEHPGRRRIRS